MACWPWWCSWGWPAASGCWRLSLAGIPRSAGGRGGGVGKSTRQDAPQSTLGPESGGIIVPAGGAVIGANRGRGCVSCRDGSGDRLGRRSCGPVDQLSPRACRSPGPSCRWGLWAVGFARLVARCPVGPEVPGPAGLFGRWPVGPLMLQVLGAGFPTGLVGRGAELQVGPGACCPLGPWGR